MESNKWIDVKDYEGLYKINKMGNIYSTKSNRILKPQLINDRYYHIRLYKTSITSHLLHRLIALHFIPNPNNYLVVDHKNQNKLDNRIENLRWISHSGNSRNRGVQGKTSNFKGVSSSSRKNKPWRAQIKIEGKTKHLGNFRTEEEAHIEYMKNYNNIMKKFENCEDIELDNNNSIFKNNDICLIKHK